MENMDDNKSNEILVADDINTLSPYDSSFPMALLTNGMNDSFHQAEEAANDIYHALVKNGALAAEASKIQSTTRYVVDMSQELLDKIESGKIKLSYGKDGKTYAQLLQDNGHFGSKLPIKKEDLVSGIDPTNIAMAMQMKAMQEQLEAIAEQINFIDENVKDVLQGQQNDRIAQYYSGVALYIEARSVTDESMKKMLIAQSMRALADATFQIKLQMESDIQYLLSGKYKDAKGKRVQLIDERMNSINKSLAVIHQASILKSAIYCEQKEYEAMAIALDEYSQLIKTDIANNAYLLAQCDPNDDGTSKGIWNTRASFKIDTQELKKQLATKEKTLYLGMEEE